MTPLQLAQAFTDLTPAARQTFVEALAEQGLDFDWLPILAFPEQEPAPLTQAQQRLWFLAQLDPGNSAYHLGGALVLSGQLSLPALQHSLDLLQQRHPNLRCQFEQQGEQIRTRILPATGVTLHRHQVASQAEAKALSEQQLRQPFELQQGPLWRVGLIELSPQTHWLYLVLPHLLTDGWSMQRLLEEFCLLYPASLEGQTAELPPLAIQYQDYARWQQYSLSPAKLARQREYWLNRHQGEAPALLDLPCDRPRPRVQSLRGARLDFELSPALSARLRAQAQQANVSLFHWGLATYQLLLWQLSGQTDLRIGISDAGRSRPETAGLIGFFVGTQVIRQQLEPRQTFHQLLQQVREHCLEAQAHPDFSFEQLVEALAPARDLSANPVFQAKFSQQLALPDCIELPGLQLSRHELDDGATHFDLGLDLTDYGSHLHGRFTYACDLFDAATLERWSQQFQQLLAFFAEQPAARLLDFRFAAATAIPTEPAQPRWPDLLSAWHQQLHAEPEAQALWHDGQHFNRRELDSAANRLARQLLRNGIQPGDRLALGCTRSPALVIGLLAAWKLGAAFVPLDLNQPRERLDELLADSGCRAILVDDLGSARLNHSLLPRLSYQQADSELFLPEPELNPASIAYCIYTSGSTGKPKGVLISHGALSQYLSGLVPRLVLKPGSKLALVSTIIADLGHSLLFAGLALGHCLYLMDDDCARDPDAFADWMAHQQIDALKIVPSHLQGLLQAQRPAQVLPRQLLILGGEAAEAGLLTQIRQHSNCRVLNHYGPTETTVGVLTDELVADQRLTLGRPLPGVDAWVLDAWQNPVSPGVSGELYLGGPQLASQYLNRPGLTAEKFVPHPFQAGARLYRTGDRVRQLADGRLQYQGRLDDQLKIRGYRIEPLEIRQRLAQLDGVQAVEVYAHPIDGRLQLVACLVPASLDRQAIRQRLSELLPDAMVPSHWFGLDALPLNPNGKVDRRALPRPEPAILAAPAIPTEPETTTEVERQLIAIWQQVLGCPVEPDANFFELGGDSILSLQLIARARKAGLKFSPKQLFERQSIRALAPYVSQLAAPTPVASPVATSVTSATPVASALSATLRWPLLPMAQGFFQLDIGNRHHWNQSLWLRARQPLQPELLRQALHAVLARHPALRCRYLPDPDQAGRWLAEPVEPVLAFDCLSLAADATVLETAIESASADCQRSLDLNSGRLFAARLLELPSGQQQLLLVAHHLAVDGLSWRILLEDLQQQYQALTAGRHQPLAEPSCSPDQAAAALMQLALSEGLTAELDHWQRQLDSGWSLPVQSAEPTQIADSAQLSYGFSIEATRRLQRLAEQAPGTHRFDSLLLSALALSLQPDGGPVQLWLEGHGREFEQLDASRCLGWFTSLYPLQLELDAQPARAWQQCQQRLQQIPRNGLGFGVLSRLNPLGPRLLKSPASIPVLFNYLGQFDSDAQSGLFDWLGPVPGGERDPTGPLSAQLALHGRILDGCLQLDWLYSLRHLSREQVELWQQRLLHCLHQWLETAPQQAEPLASTPTPAPTASTWPLAGLTDAEAAALQQRLPPLADLYPATSLQQGLLFHWALAPHSKAYVNQLIWILDGLDHAAFIDAWRQAFAAHPILRTAFVDHQGQWLQAVAQQVELPLAEYDWRQQPPTDAELERFALDELERPFNPAQAPLMRLVLARLDAQHSLLVWTRHHLLLDGWSSTLLLHEIQNRYLQQPVVPPSRSYRDQVAWLLQRDRQPEREFWSQQLTGLSAPSLLAEVLPASPDPTRAPEQRFELSRTESERLRACARHARVTPNTLFQAAWALLLGRYLGRRDLAFGLTLAGRSDELPGLEQTLGLFINSLPLILSLDPAQTVVEFLHSLQRQTLELRQFEQMPLAELQQQFGQGALFDTLLVFDSTPLTDDQTDGLKRVEQQNFERTHYFLSLLVETGTEFGFRLSQASEQLAACRVQRLGQQLLQLLRQLPDSGNSRLGTLALPLDAPPKTRPLAAFVLDPIPAQIERAAQQFGARTAVSLGARSLTYAEFWHRVDRWSQYLLSLNLAPEARIAVLADRSLELPVVMVAILSAGAVYLPLDPDLPAARLDYLLADAAPTLLLHDRSEPPMTAGASLRLESLPPITSVRRQASVPHGLQLAYLLYTSGSTGQPKGAANTHAALANRIDWMQHAYRLHPEDRVLHKTPIGFDVSVWELLWPLTQGAQLVLAAPGEHRDPAALRERILCEQITRLHFVPSMLQVFLDEPGVSQCQSLTHVFASGEALTDALCQQLYRQLPQVQLHNLYGPTEAAIDVSHWHCPPGHQGPVPIGQAITQLELLLLDLDGNPLPAGVIGELCIGGLGLARGYHQRPGLTAKAFVPHPFNPGARLYRTGDLARLGRDGQIQYLGRLDHQIKIRGQRIEPGEIEHSLRQQPGIRDALVLAFDQQGSMQLAAYLLSEQPLDEPALRHALRGLPDSMQPACFIALGQWPLSVNGKLDRKALPAPELHSGSVLPLQTPTETWLAQYWQQFLGGELPGRDAHFFRHGGHSLLAAKLVSALSQRLNQSVPLKLLFDQPVLQDLAQALDALTAKALRPERLLELDALLTELETR